MNELRHLALKNAFVEIMIGETERKCLEMFIIEFLYQRADQHIKLSNNQITKDMPVGNISASMMYSTARFNAWMQAYTCDSSVQMSVKKNEAIDYFVDEYRKMLNENLTVLYGSREAGANRNRPSGVFFYFGGFFTYFLLVL